VGLQPVLLRSGEGETIFDQPKRTIRVLADREEVALTWFRYEPGEEGPSPHVHKRHTDAFYVLEGELEVGLGPGVKRFEAMPGTLAAAPPNVVHTFRNASDAPTTFLNIHAPSMGFVEMLRAARDGGEEDAAQFDQFEPPADGGRGLSDAVLRAPGEGDSISLGQSKAIFKAEDSDVDGFFSLMETLIAPGFPGPVLHRHERMVDSFYVLDGRLSLQLGDQRAEAGPGDFALMPPTAAHTFANPGEEGVRVLNLMAPGGFEQYLKDVARAAVDHEADADLMAEIAARYDFVPA
jgi:mannose-6-phosphate isomerase-like protein (cupin superfamily)